MKRLALVLAPGFDEMEASTFLGVFGWTRAIETVEPVVLEPLSIDREVPGAHGLVARVAARIGDADPTSYAAVVVPGGSYEKGYSHVCDAPVLQFLRGIEGSGGTLVATSTGTRALAASGLLVGKRATTYPFDDGRHRAYLAECGATLSNAPLEIDGAVITCSGPNSVLEAAFSLLRAIGGDRDVEAVRKALGFLRAP